MFYNFPRFCFLIMKSFQTVTSIDNFSEKKHKFFIIFHNFQSVCLGKLNLTIISLRPFGKRFRISGKRLRTFKKHCRTFEKSLRTFGLSLRIFNSQKILKILPLLVKEHNWIWNTLNCKNDDCIDKTADFYGHEIVYSSQKIYMQIMSHEYFQLFVFDYFNIFDNWWNLRSRMQRF